MALGHVFALLGYLSKNWGVALILAGYALPFAISRELVEKRKRSIIEPMDEDA
jgi:hypothetical protein